jgi:hypothetical protein
VVQPMLRRAAPSALHGGSAAPRRTRLRLSPLRRCQAARPSGEEGDVRRHLCPTLPELKARPMTTFPFAHFARMLPTDTMRNRFSRLAHGNQHPDAERLYRHVIRARG